MHTLIGFWGTLLTLAQLAFIFQASADVLDPDQFAGSSQLISIENINITQNLSIAGNLLCQDGQYLYFNDLQSCLEMKKQNPEDQTLACGPDLTLTPINEIEELFYEQGDRRYFIWRFFSIKMSYETSKYELLADQVPQRYKLVEKKTSTVPQCTGRPALPQTNILWIKEASKSQKYLIKTLLNNNILVVNSPYGNLESIANPMTPEAQKSEKEQDFPLKTPFCNPNITNDQVMELMGGSRTGGGLNEFENLMLQNLSTEMNIVSPLSQNQWKELVQKPFDPSIEAYKVTCQPTGQVL